MEDNQTRPEISMRLAENVEEFQEGVTEITDLMEQDINFSQLTAESYDEKNLKLSTHVAELSRVHGVLVDLLADLIIEFNKKQRLDSIDSDSRKVSEASHNLKEDLQTLTEENTKLKCMIKEIESVMDSQLESAQDDIRTQNAYLELEKSKVFELQKQVVNLLLLVSDSNLKIKTIGEELEASSSKLLVAKDLLSQQHERASKQKTKQNKEMLALLHKQIDSHSETVNALQQQVAADIIAHDDQIKEFDMKINQYVSEISVLKSTHEAKEDKWNADIEKLKKELKEKCQSLDELNKKLETLILERDGVDARLDTLRAEKCSRDNLVQEMETRLKSLQAERAEVLVTFKIVQKLKDELKLKVVELEQEVHRQKEVIANTT
ncbi:hypothetical protein R6Q59_009091 [Mikania micrantha]|uniref:NAB domain-containing protein n=1 Tax=Mikania micrantha TaxID=192012 RepID=A0A5N6Q6K6_9ASTR|nr:hypothetical protein E3N88_03441 [Mikania micrantha]